MSFQTLKLLYVLLCCGLVFIILSPTLFMVVRLPAGERFSELWVLGSGHMAEDYPFNVEAHQISKIYLGIANHMGSLQYYVVYVKLRNQTELGLDTNSERPSDILPLYTYRVFLQDGDDWESPLIFSFSNVSFSENQSLIGSFVVNDVEFSVNKQAMWDSENDGYYYQLFAELWIYNSQLRTLQFHNRFVGIWLNITKTT
jgi:hypothetical protein